MHTQRTDLVPKFNELGNRTGLGSCLATLPSVISHSTSNEILIFYIKRRLFFLQGLVLSCLFYLLLLIDESVLKGTARRIADGTEK